MGSSLLYCIAGDAKSLKIEATNTQCKGLCTRWLLSTGPSFTKVARCSIPLDTRGKTPELKNNERRDSGSLNRLDQSYQKQRKSFSCDGPQCVWYFAFVSRRGCLVMQHRCINLKRSTWKRMLAWRYLLYIIFETRRLDRLWKVSSKAIVERSTQ